MMFKTILEFYASYNVPIAPLSVATLIIVLTIFMTDLSCYMNVKAFAIRRCFYLWIITICLLNIILCFLANVLGYINFQPPMS